MESRASILSVVRHLFYAMLIVVLFSSCGSGFDEDACLASVKKEFPNAKVYVPFDGSFSTFIVIDSVNVYNVETMNATSSKVTKVEILFCK